MKSARALMIALLAGGAVGTAAGGPTPRMPGGGAGGGSSRSIVVLTNNIAGDGMLRIDPDDFGAYTVWTYPDNYDYYDPAGALTVRNPAFASACFIFSGGADRKALSIPGRNVDTSYNNNVTYPSNLVLTLTSPSVASDSDGDLVNDTANSSFTVTGGTTGLNLSVQLRQRVFKPATGSSVARFEQRYTITNNSATAAQLKWQINKDFDLLWTPPEQDVAGTVSVGGAINPYMREPGGPTDPFADPTAIGLVPLAPGSVYYAGRSGYSTPAMAFGTDYQVWSNYGLPPAWENYTAGVGSAPTVGELNAAQPPGSVTPFDGFMGLQWSFSLAPSATQVIEYATVYGAPTLPAGTSCYANCDASTTPPVANVADFTCFLQKFAANDAYANCDASTTPPTINVADFTCFLQKFAAGCP